VTFIGFTHFVQEVENAFGARQCHRHRVELLRHLIDRHVDRAAELQKGGYGSQGKRTDAADGQQASNNGDQYILDVTDVSHDRHQDVCKTMSVEGIAGQFLVELVEPLFCPIFVGEYLDDLLTVDHLLDIPVGFTDCFLLGHEVRAAFHGHLGCNEEHHRQGGHHHEGQLPAGQQHCKKYRCDRNDRVDEVRNRLGDHLPEGVDIVGIQAHHIAVRVGVEVTDRQGLHVGEHGIADVLECPLGDGDHQTVVGEGRNHSACIDGQHRQQRPDEGGEGGICCPDERCYVRVYQDSQEHRSRHAAEGTDDDAEKHDDKAPLVRDDDQGEETLKGGKVKFGHSAVHPRPLITDHSHACSSLRSCAA